MRVRLILAAALALQLLTTALAADLIVLRNGTQLKRVRVVLYDGSSFTVLLPSGKQIDIHYNKIARIVYYGKGGSTRVVRPGKTGGKPGPGLSFVPIRPNTSVTTTVRKSSAGRAASSNTSNTSNRGTRGSTSSTASPTTPTRKTAPVTTGARRSIPRRTAAQKETARVTKRTTASSATSAPARKTKTPARNSQLAHAGQHTGNPTRPTTSQTRAKPDKVHRSSESPEVPANRAKSNRTESKRSGAKQTGATRTGPGGRHQATTTRNGPIIVPGNYAMQLTASDESGGPVSIYYALNGDKFQPYRGRVAFAKSGRYTIRYYAQDGAGNREAVRTALFIVDHDKPRLRYRFSGPSVRKGDLVHLRSGQILINARDEHSSLRSLACQANGQSLPESSSGALQLSIDSSKYSGLKHLTCTATDRAGNFIRKTLIVRIDRSGPTVQWNTNRQAESLQESTPVGFKVTDSGAGLARLELVLDKATFRLNRTARTFTPGRYLRAGQTAVARIRAIDRVGNVRLSRPLLIELRKRLREPVRMAPLGG